jgi:protein SCO1/2
MRRSSYLFCLWLACTPAQAALTQQDLSTVALNPSAGARVPPSLTFTDANGRAVTMSQVLDGLPALLVPVDYTCRSICGPALSIITSAVAGTHLKQGREFQLVVVGIDAKDSVQDAAKFTSTQLGPQDATILRGDAANIEKLLDSIGYKTRYDATNDQFAHPSGILTLSPDGHVSHVLSELALGPRDIELAVADAAYGRTEDLGTKLLALCYGFDAAHGIYTLAIKRILSVACLATLAAMAWAVLMLHRRGRRAS